MYIYLACSLALLLPSPVFSQLALPNPQYTPPDASFGAQPSNTTGTSVNVQWSTLLGNLLYFYDAQRSGKLPSTNRVPWRNNSAVDDGQDVGLDLSGGYYDAGDYMKYSFPLSFSLMSICWNAVDFGQGYDLANQTAYLDDMLRWGLDWLIKAHPSSSTLYVQVGVTDLDNSYWGGDQGIPTPRTSYQINDTSPGTDAAALASAAFAACSALYANHTLNSSAASLQNSSYASTLLSHAQQLYSFAVNATGGQRTYQTSVPASADAYASSGYGDDLTMAALFLTLASDPSSGSGTASTYYADAGAHYYAFDLGSQMQPGDEEVFNWDSATPGAVVLAAQLAHAYPSVVATSNATIGVWQDTAEAYFDAIVAGKGRGYLTGGGLLYYPGDSDEASLNPSLNAAMLLTRYASSGLASTQNKMNSYLAFAQSQVDYALGKNPMTVPYVVGAHPNSPANPHSAISTGASPEDINNIDTVPQQEAYVIYGGVVGGPDAHGQFWDLRGDWAQGEVALDYNAPLLALAAHALVAGTSDPYYMQVTPGSYGAVRPSGYPCDAAVQTGCKHKGLSEGGKIAVGVVNSENVEEFQVLLVDNKLLFLSNSW
ncbi:Endoglucanase E-4 [Grifola frondosa]|uniref:Endoglucanase n=1 Tax=Grifola frondosa TaxID=5627 RepID=A0A1C7MJL9_GRIFR|nr:Endoglucanase E-4 [Grifola frondosa]